MDTSQDMFDDSIGDFITQKDQILSGLIDSFSGYCELSKRIEHIKIASKFVNTFNLTVIEEEFLKHVLPVVVRSFEEVYEKNCELLNTNQEELEEIRSNFQIALSLVEETSKFLKPISNHDGVVQFRYIPSLLISIAQIVLSTFEHCKNSQKICTTRADSLREIITLFKDTQSLHSKLLSILENRVRFECTESDRKGANQILGTLCDLSKVISGLNARSMTDNWRGYTTLNKKYTEILHKTPSNFDLSLPIKIITDEIGENLNNLKKFPVTELKAATYSVKVTGFLARVAVKLFEINWDILNDFYKDVISFYIVLHSCSTDYFKSKQFPNEFIHEFNQRLKNVHDEFILRLLSEESFIEYVISLNHSLLNHSDASSFGLLSFLKEVFTKLCEKGNGFSSTNQLGSLINLMFNLIGDCFCELSTFDLCLYQEFAVNVTVLVLIHPDLYPEVELVLLKNIVHQQEEIWSAILAIDVWTLILGNSAPSTTFSIFQNLLSIIDGLNLGIFNRAPQAIYLKLLIRRIFDLLPHNFKSEIISTHSPSDNLPIWKYLDLKAIPLSQRFHIETILIDLYEKIDRFHERPLEDFLFVGETLDILSSVQFDAIQLNTSKLTLSIGRLWSFDSCNVPLLNNNFFKYFIDKLARITKILIHQFPGDVLCLILHQVEVLARNGGKFFKILANHIIQPLASMTFDHFHEKSAILAIITGISLILFNDSNGIILVNALENFREFSTKENFSTISRTIKNNAKSVKLLGKFDEKSLDFNFEYLKKISQLTFQHKCIDWGGSKNESNESPKKKKLKTTKSIVDSDAELADDIINDLKNEAKRLQRVIKTSRLNPKQVQHIRGIINRLEMICN